MATGQFPQRRETDEEAAERVEKIEADNREWAPDYELKEKLTVPIELRPHRKFGKSEHG